MITKLSRLCGQQKLRLTAGLFALLLTSAGVYKVVDGPTVKTGAPWTHWLPVANTPLTQRIELVGKIMPRSTLFLTTPFDGDVQDYLVEEGQAVQAGEHLMRMDTSLIQAQLREALAVQLKARRNVQDLQDWSGGNQVMRAQRAMRVSEMQFLHSQGKLRVSQDLFTRGIIARDELNDLAQQTELQRLDMTAAKDELQQVLREGRGDTLQIAEMELVNATEKYDALLSLLENRYIVAPFAGIIVPTETSRGANETALAPVQAGSKVTQGQVLFGLANIEQLKIVSHVSELDINRLQRGQRVEIFGDGFDQRLSATVESVSRLALRDDDAGKSARFPITLLIDKMSAEELAQVRLGMSVRLSIITHSNSAAMIVPPSAIRKTAGSATVSFRESVEMPPRQIEVTVGQSTVEGVEVFGLSEGLVRVFNE